MALEGEKNIALPSTREKSKEEVQTSLSFKDKVAKSLEKFSPELKNKTLNLIDQHNIGITNKNLFLRKLSRLVENMSEEEAFLHIKQLVEKEVQYKEEQLDLAQNPRISAYIDYSKEKKSKYNKVEINDQEVNDRQIEIQEHLQKTRDAYSLIKAQYTTHTDAEKQEKLQSLSPKLQRQLKKSGIPLQEYASFLLSREKIGKDYQDPRNIAFLKSLERLERNLGISEQTAGGYPTSFEWKTKTFRENPDLKTFVQKSQDFSDLEKLEYFGNEREHEENEKLIALFGDHDLQELHRLCTPLLEKNIQEQSPSEQQLLQTYQQQLEHLKAKQKNELLLDMKASTINAPIPMMMYYLDKESLGGKSLANLLEKAPQDAISIHTEGKGLS